MHAPSPCVSAGRLTECAWDRPIQCARYLVNIKNTQLAMRQCPLGADAAFFSGSPTPKCPVPGSSYAGACMRFATGDPAVAETAMSGAIWARCLVPPKPGDSPGAAELVLASVAVKNAEVRRIQAAELKQGPWEPTTQNLDALTVLHGTAADKVS